MDRRVPTSSCWPRGDEILVSEMEHHANLVPWAGTPRQDRGSAAVDGTDDGRLDLNDLDVITERTCVVSSSISPTSRAPSILWTSAARPAVGALVVPDACQSVLHLPVDVRTLDIGTCMAFSGQQDASVRPASGSCSGTHDPLMAEMPPFISGGSMIRSVTMERSTYADPPQRFEAGADDLPGGGLAAATDHLRDPGWKSLRTGTNSISRRWR